MYSIGECYHVSHCVADLPAADRWFRDVFGAHLIQKDYVEEALRDASFWVIGDYVWEVVCPADRPGADHAPMGRFLARYGPRLHSFSWWVDEPSECVAGLRHAGVRVVDVAGVPVTPAEVGSDAAVFTHPRDSHGMLEFAGPECTPHMRMPVGGAPPITHWSEDHPLGLQKISHLTSVVEDLSAATEKLVAALGATLGARSSRAGDSESVLLGVGSTRLELRAPTSADGPTGRWLTANGEGSYTVCFTVADLGQAGKFLGSLGLDAREVAPGVLALDPDAGLGVAYEFAT